jgi:hypothetical protein
MKGKDTLCVLIIANEVTGLTKLDKYCTNRPTMLQESELVYINGIVRIFVGLLGSDGGA